MKNVYNIPLQYKSGKFYLSDITELSDEDVLIISHDSYDILSYNVPQYGTDVRLYSITKESIENTLSVIYNENGNLENIEITCGNKTKLVYIHFADNETAKETVQQFANFYADKISNKIINYKEKIARLFIEYFYDGVAVDFAAKIGTVSDMQTVIEKYKGNSDTANNSGNYPYENRIASDSDTETLGILLLNADTNFRNELFNFAVREMTGLIKKRVLNIIDKADNFKFISEEYD